MNFRVTKSVVLAVAAAASMVSASAYAQDKPAAKPPADASASRWDIFAGYSYLAPHGTVQVIQPSTFQVLPVDYKAVDVGGLFSAAYFFNRYVGAQAEYGFHEYGSA